MSKPAPFTNITNLCFETPDVTLDNYLVIITETVSSILEHWATFNYSKIAFIQGTTLSTDPKGNVRIGFLFVNKETLSSNKEEGISEESLYRYKWLRFPDKRLSDIARVQLSHTLALALCDSTTLKWNALSIGSGIIAIAPTKAITQFMNRGNKNGSN